MSQFDESIMQKHNNNLGIRKLGIIVCFQKFHAENQRYPDTPEELSTVTSSVLHENRFLKYKSWFHEYTDGEQQWMSM